MTKKHSHSKHKESAPEETPDAGAAATPEEAAPPAAEEAAAETSPEPVEPLQHQLLRLQADFENFRKRMTREKQEWISFGNEKLLLDLLPVMDHFELGLADAAKNGAPAAFTEGFQLICNQLSAVLEKAGVRPIEAEGQPFDPNLHEAITHMPSDTVPEEHVVTQTRRGYKLGDRLLRAAQVVVSSGPAGE